MYNCMLKFIYIFIMNQMEPLLDYIPDLERINISLLIFDSLDYHSVDVIEVVDFFFLSYLFLSFLFKIFFCRILYLH